MAVMRTIAETSITAIALPRGMQDVMPTITETTGTAIDRPRRTGITASKPEAAIITRDRATAAIIMVTGDMLPWWAPITPAH